MKGNRKWFDKDLYKQYDSIAKLSSIRLFKRLKGLSLDENEKLRGVDMLIYKDKKHKYYLECEIKNQEWSPGKFPFPTVNLPERKEKYCKLNKPTLFIIFNKDQTAYICFWGKDVLKSKKEEVRNRYVYNGELFFKIPVKKCYQNIKDAFK